MPYVLLAAIILFILYQRGYIGRQTTKEPEVDPQKAMPYRKKEYFFSQAELSFFRVLSAVTGDLNMLVFAKVRLPDLVYIPGKNEEWAKYWNKIKAKHVDFVLCDKAAAKPLLLIELDDASHQQSKRVERDDFMDSVLAQVGLSILRVPVKHAYNVAELTAQINAKLSESKPEARVSSGALGED